jgi:hypothetical protein
MTHPSGASGKLLIARVEKEQSKQAWCLSVAEAIHALHINAFLDAGIQN